MVRVNLRSNIFRIIVVIILIVSAIILLKRHQRLSVEVRGQLIRRSLEAEFKNRYLPLPPYPGKNVEPKDIFILDSSIIRNNLPELPGGRFILLNSIAIADSAVRTGEFYYIQLSQLSQYPDSATIVWESASGILSRKFNRIVYQTYKFDEFKYSLTPTGWNGGLSKMGHYLNLQVQ